MSKLYSLEFAVKSDTEIQAMEQLKALGITRAEEAKLSDLDRQAGLFIIRVDVEEAELTDDVYKKLLAAKDVFILSDELSAKRARKIISLTTTVEKQLKKLLICVLPETEKVFNDIVSAHQKHESQLKPTNRIEWCRKINDFSFGELPEVLEEDVSELAKKQLLSSEGLLSLIISAKDFDTFKKEIMEISRPKTVWNSINTILEKPANYSNVASSLNDLCLARNDAAHLNTITAKRLAEVEKDQKHIMSYIGNTKSSYRDSLQLNMKSLAEAMKPILESAVKIDPLIFTEYQKMISEMFKPFTDTISKLNLNVVSPDFTTIIKHNTDYQSQIAKSFTGVFENMKVMDGFNEAMEHLSRSGFSEYMANSLKEASRLKLEIDRTVEAEQKADENHTRLDEDGNPDNGDTDEGTNISASTNSEGNKK